VTGDAPQQQARGGERDRACTADRGGDPDRPLLWRLPINTNPDFGSKLERRHGIPLGNDDLGQDVLESLIYGGRIRSRSGLRHLVSRQR